MLIDKKCKICRRAGEKLFLKGERCYTPKCSLERKPTPPGKGVGRGRRPQQMSEYGKQFREKQKVRFTYRVSEEQFSKYVREATGKSGVSPVNYLYELLERRLDSFIFRVGLAPSRSLARHIVSHGHVTVNGRRVTIPSFMVKKGDVVGIRKNSATNGLFTNVKERVKAPTQTPWAKFNASKVEWSIDGKPRLEKDEMPFDLVSVIEFYSR